MPILSPDKFAEWFSAMVPGAYRTITAQDVRDMTNCGLIGRYGLYYHSDLPTVRAILQYEQLRQNRRKRDEIRDANGAIHCRRCGALLTSRQDLKKGRPKEYCADCEPLRGRDRYRKWREKQTTTPNYKTKNGLVSACQILSIP